MNITLPPATAMVRKSNAAMLKDKIAIVTGSTSGIGLGIAKALAGEGANIVLNGFGDWDEIKAIEPTSSATTACV